MAAPAYTTDLITISQAEEAAGTWLEPTDADYDDGSSHVQDADYPYIQGSYAVLQGTTKTGIAALMFNNGSGITIPTDGAVLIWQNFYSPPAIDDYANGGLRVIIGSSLANFDAWYVGGKDVGRMPYGGWQNWAVNPTVSYDDRSGTGAGTLQYFGCAAKITTAISKGYPHNIDALRYGRAEARFSGGDAGNGYAVLTGFVALNDATSARWGLIQATPGGYLWKGLISLGESNKSTATRARSSNIATLTFSTAHKFKVGDVITVIGLGGTGYNVTAVVASVPASTSLTYNNSGGDESQTADTDGLVGCIVDFRDSNRIIFIDDTRKVTTAFNRIEIKHASSRVDLTGYSFTCVGPSTSASKGQLAVIEDAEVTIDSCLFQDMDTFVFDFNSAIYDSIFRRCGQITQGEGIFDGCTFDQPSGAVGFLADLIANVTNCSFISDGTGHAIQGFAVAGSYDLSSLSFSGYAASDGSTGNEAIYVTATTGIVTLSFSGTAPSVRSAGATIVKLVDQVTLTISPIVAGSDVVIYEAGTTTIIESSQNIAGTSYAFVYDEEVGDYIDVGLFKEGYTPFYIRNYQLGASSTTLPATQQVDRFYIS